MREVHRHLYVLSTESPRYSEGFLDLTVEKYSEGIELRQDGKTIYLVGGQREELMNLLAVLKP